MASTRTVICSACGKQSLHKSRGWCSACYKRWLAHGRPDDGPPPRRKVRCGTPQGWNRHMYRKEPACDPCRAAHRDDVSEWAAISAARLQRTRHFTEPTPRSEWTDEQKRTARNAAMAAPDPTDRHNLLEALGLAPSIPDRRRTPREAA